MKIKNKKFCIFFLFCALIVSIVSCKKSDNEDSVIVYKIGICNFVDDASLNQIVENIRISLSEIEKTQNVKFKIFYDNCNADANLLNQIISNFIADKVDLMIGVATPVAMAMQNATEQNKIPVVFAAVSDPLSCSLVEDLQIPGANITGTSDYLDSNAVLNLIFALKPNIKKVGLLYDVSQDSSATPIRIAKKILSDRSIDYIERTGSTVDEVMLAAQALVSDKVEAVFTPTDNTIMTAELSIYKIFSDAAIPHFAGADSFALNGAFIGYGVDYAYLGRCTGTMAADILINGKDPGKISVMTFDNGIATINTETSLILGYDYNELVNIFDPFCTKIKKIKTAESF